MTTPAATSSPRKTELLDAAYAYVTANGLTHVSLRPLASAIGSSPRVLLYLFGSKEGLVRELLAKARAEQVTMLHRIQAEQSGQAYVCTFVEQAWSWFTAPGNRPLLVLWTEAYVQAIANPKGPWSGFAEATVDDWLAELRTSLGARPDAPDEEVRRRAALAMLRGALLDLLATGDAPRVTRAVEYYVTATCACPSPHDRE